MPSILDEWATLLAVLSPPNGQQEKDISICREYLDYKYATSPGETTDGVLLRRRVLIMAIQYLRDVSDLSADRQDLSTISSIAQVSTQNAFERWLKVRDESGCLSSRCEYFSRAVEMWTSGMHGVW